MVIWFSNGFVPICSNVGWYKVKCPVSYQTMMEKYILSGLSSMGNFSKGWKTILYGHFKNFGETYMSCQCKKAKSQRDFVLARRLERISLQRRHFVSVHALKREFKLKHYDYLTVNAHSKHDSTSGCRP